MAPVQVARQTGVVGLEPGVVIGAHQRRALRVHRIAGAKTCRTNGMRGRRGIQPAAAATALLDPGGGRVRCRLGCGRSHRRRRHGAIRGAGPQRAWPGWVPGPASGARRAGFLAQPVALALGHQDFLRTANPGAYCAGGRGAGRGRGASLHDVLAAHFGHAGVQRGSWAQFLSGKLPQRGLAPQAQRPPQRHEEHRRDDEAKAPAKLDRARQQRDGAGLDRLHACRSGGLPLKR